jgi:hypothetical protein
MLLPKLPDGVVPIAPNHQLAPGSTRGSRHCIRHADMPHVQFYGWLNANPLEGPILVFEKETMIEHPEHGDQLWPPCIVAITYQRRHAEEVRRVTD